MDHRHLLQLLSVPRIGPLKLRALLQHFDEPLNVLRASPLELIRVPGIDKKLARAIVHHADGAAFAEDQLRRIEKAGIQLVSLWDDRYPELLKRIYDPPPLLFLNGTLAPEDRRSIALVGTRTPSPYGRRTADEWTRAFVQLGFTIVSGLARGVDTAVHQSALAHAGRTIAVIGSGLDIPYPPENRKLQEHITESGAVVSEFPMGTKPDAQNFPRRNRIISGLSLGTIIVESGEDGGAMITASLALDQNREVFAIPGSIFEGRSIGPHRLIQTGRAKLAHKVEDVLEELGVTPSQSSRKHVDVSSLNLTLFEQALYTSLEGPSLHLDEIADKNALGTSDVLVTLLSLEFKGLVRQLPGKMFERMEPMA